MRRSTIIVVFEVCVLPVPVGVVCLHRACVGVSRVARACCSGHSIRFVSMSQSWPLSQDANKSSGTCSVCLATRQLHLRDGTIRRHGPRSAPRSGSNKLPLNVVSQPLAVSASPSLSATDGSFTSSPLSGTRMGSSGNGHLLTVHSSNTFLSQHPQPALPTSLQFYVRFRLYLNLSQPGWICSTGAIPYCSPLK